MSEQGKFHTPQPDARRGGGQKEFTLRMPTAEQQANVPPNVLTFAGYIFTQEWENRLTAAGFVLSAKLGPNIEKLPYGATCSFSCPDRYFQRCYGTIFAEKDVRDLRREASVTCMAIEAHLSNFS